MAGRRSSAARSASSSGKGTPSSKLKTLCACSSQYGPRAVEIPLMIHQILIDLAQRAVGQQHPKVVAPQRPRPPLPLLAPGIVNFKHHALLAAQLIAHQAPIAADGHGHAD